ncbi:MAG: hypothetical protein ACI3XR_00965, partial [Eubacteriales bacterium]
MKKYMTLALIPAIIASALSLTSCDEVVPNDSSVSSVSEASGDTGVAVSGTTKPVSTTPELPFNECVTGSEAIAGLIGRNINL